MASPPPLLIKKYSNRRLYDTGESRYVTVEELATKVRGGTDVRVIDAQTGDDLTQSTLTQIILESRGAGRLLPVPLLFQLIRMGDDALAEFMSRYLAFALETYLQAKQGAQSLGPFSTLGQLPLQATSALARVLLGQPLWGEQSPPPSAPAPPPASPPPAAPPPSSGELAELRRELDDLKRSLRRRKAR